MNYFKPELLARCRSRGDVAEAAAAEWEAARAAYRARLDAIRPSLPAAVRRLLSIVSLHDAKVLGMSIGKRKPRFALRVRLEGTARQPGEVLEVSYRPVVGPNGGVTFQKPPLAEAPPPGPQWVLYDEFDVDEDRGLFVHSLLLTSGMEISVRFHSLSVQYLEEIASPLQLHEGQRTWPLVEA
jgi:hypothetical protein